MTNCNTMRTMYYRHRRSDNYGTNRNRNIQDKTGIEKQDYNLLLEDYLDDLEDIYLSEKVLTDIRSGKERTYSADEVYKDLGL